MEVREQLVDDMEVETGADKEIRFTEPASNHAGLFIICGLQSSDARRPHRHDFAPLPLRPHHFTGDRFVDLIRFGVHMMIFQAFGSNRQERPCPYMKRDGCDLDASFIDSF